MGNCICRVRAAGRGLPLHLWGNQGSPCPLLFGEGEAKESFLSFTFEKIF